MITQKRNLFLLLAAFGLAISLKTTTAATTTVGTTKPPAVLPTIPEGIFTKYPYHQPNYDFGQTAAATFNEDTATDNDLYVPYRSDEHDNFSWELLKDVLQEEHTKNVVVSPFSVKLVVAILAEAAGNGSQTLHELNEALTGEFKSESKNLREYYKKILPALKRSSAEHTLNLETKLYADDFIEPQQRYAARLQEYYDTRLERLHFADTRTSADAVNAWASNVTYGRLQGLVTEDNIRNNVLLLANVIYYKGLWRREFNETYPGAFFRTPTEQMRVEYMEQTEHFYRYDSSQLDAKILRLPYKGASKFAMFVVLPKTKCGVDELLVALENDQYKHMQWRMERTKVKVTLPKFKFDFKKQLKETLGHLGIHDIFENSASLPGLARGAGVAGRLKVSDIYQKAGIEVNERGTEAYASTVVEIENKFGGTTPVEEFNVNRPFVFFIEDETSGNIIFAGKVLEPYL